MKQRESDDHRWITGANLVSAFPDFALSGLFAISWIAPYAFGAHILKRLELIMLMEFFIVHSSAFMGAAMTMPRRRITRVLGVIGLGMFYTIFVGSFAYSFGTIWPLVSFWMLLVNRMLAIIMGPAPQPGDFNFIVLGWAACSFFYLIFALITSIAAIPRFGITATVLAAQPMSGGGIWADEPWRVVAFGVFYFASVAVTELFGLGAPPRAEPSGPPIPVWH